MYLETNDLDSNSANWVDLSSLGQPGSNVRRVYVIGQLHGAIDALQEIDDRIVDDLSRIPVPGAAVLHAGGYIDRGGRVPELLDALVLRSRVGTAAVVYLMGAHEWLMRRAVAGEKRAAVLWLLSGAEASLDAWNVQSEGWSDELTLRLPSHHLQFLMSLPLVARYGPDSFACSSFFVQEARPFGLLRVQPGPEPLFRSQSFTPIGRQSDLMNGVAPPSWLVRDSWTSGKVRCVVLERN